MKILKLFQLYQWEILGFFLLTLALFVNFFPEGYIVLGGDVLQPLRMDLQYIQFHYDQGWLGRASLFFSIFYFLSSIGISDTGQLSWYLGIFLFGSYFSFLWFRSLLFPYISRGVATLMALFYATNVYTLYIFTATWGFTNYQILYVFIPALVGLYIRALRDNGYQIVRWFFLFMVLASMSFGNPAFALSTGIFFFFLTVFLFGFRLLQCDIIVLKKIIIIAIGSLLINLYWVLPLLPQVRSGVHEVAVSTEVNLSERLSKTSNAIFDTVRLLQTSEQDKYYPANFPYNVPSWIKKYLLALAFIPFFIVLLGAYQKREGSERRFYALFFGMFVLFIALVARVRFPFDTVNNFLFQLPGLNVLRGYDKMAIFMPFLLSTLLLLTWSSITTQWKKAYVKIAVAGFLGVIILLALPFYRGDIQTRMSFILRGKKDFQDAKYSALVKIPEVYYDLGQKLDAESGDAKQAMLPYTPGSSIGKVNLPDLKINGPDMMRGLTTKKYVELTDAYIPGWKFAEEFSDGQYDPQWIVDLYGLIGVKYVVYHKDAMDGSKEKFEPARQYLEKIGALEKKEENASFILYYVNNERLFPYVYTNSETLSLNTTPDGLSDVVRDFRRSMLPYEYHRNNPLKITLPVDDRLKNTNVFLNEKYNPLWVAQYVDANGERTMLSRADGPTIFANAWQVGENVSSGGTIEIYFSPLRLMYMGQIVSGITLLGLIGWLVVAGRNKKKDNL